MSPRNLLSKQNNRGNQNNLNKANENLKLKNNLKMDPSEIEFLAERERVEIVPNFSEGKMFLLDGDVGPFKAGRPLEVS